MSQVLVSVLKHNTWATLNVLDLCKSVDPALFEATAPGTYGKVNDTLLHIVAAEERYASALTGYEAGEVASEGDEFPGIEDLQRRSRSSGAAIADFAGQLEPGLVLESSYRGQTRRIPAEVLIIQTVNHATEHRAHVITILTQNGVEAPWVDGWAYGSLVLGME